MLKAEERQNLMENITEILTDLSMDKIYGSTVKTAENLLQNLIYYKSEMERRNK